MLDELFTMASDMNFCLVHLSENYNIHEWTCCLSSKLKIGEVQYGKGNSADEAMHSALYEPIKGYDPVKITGYTPSLDSICKDLFKPIEPPKVKVAHGVIRRFIRSCPT